jgi:hypothetical protein
MDVVHTMGRSSALRRHGRSSTGRLAASKTANRLVLTRGMTRAGPSSRRARACRRATLLLKVQTREEAIGWAEALRQDPRDGELEVGKVNEPWDSA